LANNQPEGMINGDLLQVMEFDPEDMVGMVGFFAPLVAPIKNRVRSLKIFERNPHPPKGVLEENKALEFLPQCQIALLTSSAIINHSIDDFLHAASSCREVVLLGASTPLIQEILHQTPVTCLSGVCVTRPQEILNTVSEGGGMRQFRGSIEKVNLKSSALPNKDKIDSNQMRVLSIGTV
jgi:uncharacterized protein (DUF4213/DUF364 family)